MGLKYFRGRVDMDRLSLADTARIAGAFAAIEELAAAGVLTFEYGASRNAGPRADRVGKRVTDARPRLQESILAVLSEGGRLNFWQIQEATGMQENSLSPNLYALAKQGLVLKEAFREPGDVGRPKREKTFYSLTAPSEEGS